MIAKSHYSRSLFVFRRDLRVEDNTALNAALSSSDEVLTAFIFDPAQCEPHPYRSDNGLCFLIESLESLSEQLVQRNGKLWIFAGPADKVVSELITNHKFEALFINKDYTPFSRARDQKLHALVTSQNRAFHSFSDALLTEPTKFSKPDGAPYTVFTPFYKRALQQTPTPPAPCTTGTFVTELPAAPATVFPRDFWPATSALKRVHVGGHAALHKLFERLPTLTSYSTSRDIPSLQGTSQLSPHHKFGTCSVRQSYALLAQTFGREHALIRELYWRDFFTHIAWHFPYVFSGAFKRQYDALPWSEDTTLFAAWCNAETGFPIVDAGIRELTQTGFMHNRVRMIVASFLVKDLHWSWRHGEQFFARHLTDYDPAVNNGSWQWAASTGCDAQPYFRIFNPVTQGEKFDPKGDYVLKYVPELKGVPHKYLHKPWEIGLEGYPEPLTDLGDSRKEALARFKALRS